MGGFSTAVPGPITQGYNINPPAVDPYANLRALAMQGQIAQQKQTLAAGQQEMQTTALNQQLIQQKITDQKALGQALRDWDPNSSPITMIKSIADNGGSGEAIAGFQQHIADMQLKNAQASEATLKAQQTRHEQLASQVQAVIDAKPEDKQSLYTQYLPQIRKELDPGDPIPPDVYPGDDWGGGQVKGHQLISAQTKQDLEKAQAGKETAEAGKANIEKQLAQHKIDLYDILQRNPQELGQRVAASINPQKYPDLYARTLNEARNQPDIDHINAAIEKGAQAVTEQERTISTETNPQVLAARTNQRVNEETRLAPIRRENAIAESKALREGDNPALAGVPPALAQFATSSVMKLDEQQIKANEATESLGRLLDLADKSNVAAGANIPLAGVGAVNAINGIRRINSAEIAQYGTAGSLIQRIQGKLGGWVDGQPIPASVRDDIRELHQQLGEASYKAYTQGINSVNARSGAKYGPTVQAPNIRKGPATVNMKAPDGTVKPVPADQVEHFKSKGATVVP